MTGGGELVTHNLLDAHSRLRIAGGVSIAPVTLFDVFAEGELDAGRGAFKLQLFRADSPAHFDNLVLSANRIRGTMENICRGCPSRQLPVDDFIIWVDEIADANFGCNGLPGFVNAAIRSTVRVTVDDARCDVLACRINDHSACGRSEIGSDCGDFAALYQNRCVLQFPGGS